MAEEQRQRKTRGPSCTCGRLRSAKVVPVFFFLQAALPNSVVAAFGHSFHSSLAAVLPTPSSFAGGAESLASLSDPCGLQPCLADMTDVVNNFGFPAGFDDQLTTICRKLTQSLRCIDEKFLGCVSSAGKRRAALELKNAADFLRDLCNDSDFHRDYLRHAQCFNNVTNQNAPTGCWYFTSTIVVHYRKLAETFHRDGLEQWGSFDARNEAAKMYMHAICCAYGEFMPCAYRASFQNCGPNAAQFAFNYMWRMTSPVFQETCHHLKRWRSCDSRGSLFRSLISSGAGSLSAPGKKGSRLPTVKVMDEALPVDGPALASLLTAVLCLIATQILVIPAATSIVGDPPAIARLRSSSEKDAESCFRRNGATRKMGTSVENSDSRLNFRFIGLTSEETLSGNSADVSLRFQIGSS